MLCYGFYYADNSNYMRIVDGFSTLVFVFKNGNDVSPTKSSFRYTMMKQIVCKLLCSMSLNADRVVDFHHLNIFWFWFRKHIVQVPMFTTHQHLEHNVLFLLDTLQQVLFCHWTHRICHLKTLAITRSKILFPSASWHNEFFTELFVSTKVFVVFNNVTTQFWWNYICVMSNKCFHYKSFET